MAKVIFFTSAYNAEKTIRRCVESVLNQTYTNFLYYLLNNGSEDSTGNIIAEYAEKDKRIIQWNNEINHQGKSQFTLFSEPCIKDEDYYCLLDADDEYKPDFLEKMMIFMNEYHLDVAACGSDLIDTMGLKRGLRLLENNLIIEDRNSFSNHFSTYHQFMRTVWGKMYSLTLLRKCNFEKILIGRYGNDTIFAMETFRNAKRVGIIAQSLHKYYISNKSVSYSFNSKRIISDQILDQETRAFLLDKCGMISSQNDQALYYVYLNAVRDTLSVLLNAQIEPLEKIKHLQSILNYKATKELLFFPPEHILNSEVTKRLRTPIVDWFVMQKKFRTPKGAKIVAHVLLAVQPDLLQLTDQYSLEYLFNKMPEIIRLLLKNDYDMALEQLQKHLRTHNSDVFILTSLELNLYFALNKPENEIFALLIDIREKRSLSSEPLNIDAQISAFLAKYPLLKNISANLAAAFSRAVGWVIKGDYQKALDKFISVDNVEIDEDDAEAYILLGQNLSAAAENVDAYLYFKKVWISYLLDCSRKEEAGKELDEFKQLLPGDEDIAALCQRLII